MIIDDLWDSHGPSRHDLEVLERIGRHRRAFQRLRPGDEYQTTVRNRLLDLLDVMEETVCEEGCSAPSLAEAWQRVDELEARYWESARKPAPAEADPAPAGPQALAPFAASRPRPGAETSASPGPRAPGEAMLAANERDRSPKAA